MSYLVLTDIHGCFDEMIKLLREAGWYIYPTKDGDLHDHSYHISLGGDSWTVEMHNTGSGLETIVMLGDLGDRGPKSDLVFEFAWQMQDLGLLKPISGNHCNKLMRYLLGNPVKVSHGLEKTIEQIDRRGDGFKTRLLEFLSSLPYKFECKEFIGVHAALVEKEKEKDEKQIALYGVIDNKAGLDENGYPKRLLSWFEWYRGSRPVVFGHIVHQEVTYYDTVCSKAIALDTGGVTGGKLSAIRFPGEEIFQVDCPEYHESKDKSYTGPRYERA